MEYTQKNAAEDHKEATTTYKTMQRHADGKSFKIDDQFVCYKCGGTISRKELSNLPREHERLGGGVCTLVVCPLCNKRTIGAEWRIK